MGFFNKFTQKRPQIVNVDDEIHRIATYMWEYEGNVESISIDKILISEEDYNAIWKGICKIIADVVVEEAQGIDETQCCQLISRGQNLANRIIDKLYDIEWEY